MKIGKKDVSAALGCALLLPPGGFIFSYFVLDCGWRGCIIAVLSSFTTAAFSLAVYIWRSQKKEEKSENSFRVIQKRKIS